ncbi:MAG: GAF domain-containing protein, partial [Fibrobacter sp.]|nr:GAF domain-containing protein [Fibrobacter sp.]
MQNMEPSDDITLAGTDPIEFLKSQNEMLKSQLMSTSLIHELTKVLHSCTDFESIIKTVLLAIQEILEFDRVILFEINKDKFSLQTSNFVGISSVEVNHLSIPLGFDGGEITDALFLNRHIIIEEPDPSNIFFKELHSTSYLVIPLISKINKRCWEAKHCEKTFCPAHGSINPYCWSIMGCGQLNNAKSEDHRRHFCIECNNFKVDGVLWMDRFQRKTPISSDDVTI